MRLDRTAFARSGEYYQMSGQTISVTIGDTQRPDHFLPKTVNRLIMKALIKPMRVGDRVLIA